MAAVSTGYAWPGADQADGRRAHVHGLPRTIQTCTERMKISRASAVLGAAAPGPSSTTTASSNITPPRTGGRRRPHLGAENQEQLRSRLRLRRGPPSARKPNPVSAARCGYGVTNKDAVFDAKIKHEITDTSIIVFPPYRQIVPHQSEWVEPGTRKSAAKHGRHSHDRGGDENIMGYRVEHMGGIVSTDFSTVRRGDASSQDAEGILAARRAGRRGARRRSSDR